MPSRGQSVVLQYTAWDTNANVGRTGDVSNHVLRWTKDGTTSPPTNTPTEVDAANAPGEYKLTLTSAECTCDLGKLAGKSSSTNVSIIPIAVTFEQLPTVAPAASGGLPTVGTGTGQVNPTGGKVPATLLASDVTGNVPADLQTIKTFTVSASSAISFAPGQVGTSNYAGGAVASVIAPVTVGTITDKTGYSLTSGEHTTIAADVLNAVATSYNTAGSIGNKINSAASAGDPWTATLPGAYGAGTAGNILGNRLDVLVSTRSTYAGGAVASVTAPVTVGTITDKTGYSLTGAEHTAIGADVQAALTAQGYTSARGPKLDSLDVAVSTRSIYAGADTTGTTASLALLKDFLALAPTGAIVSASSPNTVRVSVNLPVGLTMPTAADFARIEVRLLSGADWLSTAKIAGAANVAGNQVDLSLSPGFSVAPVAGALIRFV